MTATDLAQEAYAATHRPTDSDITAATHGATYGATQTAAWRVLAQVVRNITTSAGDLDFSDAVEDALRESTAR